MIAYPHDRCKGAGIVGTAALVVFACPGSTIGFETSPDYLYLSFRPQPPA